MFVGQWIASSLTYIYIALAEKLCYLDLSSNYFVCFMCNLADISFSGTYVSNYDLLLIYCNLQFMDTLTKVYFPIPYEVVVSFPLTA